MRAANSMETEMKGNNAAAQTKKHQHRDLFFCKKGQVFFVLVENLNSKKKGREAVRLLRVAVD